MEKKFNPGSFRFKIDFLKPPIGKDDYGEPLEEWPIFKPGVYASKEPILGNEYFTALTTDTKVDVKFNSRYIKGVNDKMRIKHGDEVYEILSAIDVKSMHKELLCYCRLVD